MTLAQYSMIFLQSFRPFNQGDGLINFLVSGGFGEPFPAMARNSHWSLTKRRWNPTTSRTTELPVPTDEVNKKAGLNDWHDGPSNITGSSVGLVSIAINHGPRYFNSKLGYHQLVLTLVPSNKGDQRFTQGTMTMSSEAAHLCITRLLAVQSEEGLLQVIVTGETVESSDEEGRARRVRRQKGFASPRIIERVFFDKSKLVGKAVPKSVGKPGELKLSINVSKSSIAGSIGIIQQEMGSTRTRRTPNHNETDLLEGLKKL